MDKMFSNKSFAKTFVVVMLGVLLIPALYGNFAVAAPALKIEVIGEEELVFDYDRDACEELDFPDAPARAIRIGDRTRLYAPHFINRSMFGSSLDDLVQDCVVNYEGSQSADPAEYDDLSWIVAPYVVDEQTVISLIHTEYQGHRHKGRCSSPSYHQCWMNSISVVPSIDGGRTFERPKAEERLVAMLPYQYDGDAGKTTGYMNPSNIIRKDGAFFFLAYAASYGHQKSGNCIFRADHPAKAKNWRAWDGKSFSVEFRNPYAQAVGDPAAHICEPVSPLILTGPIMSVTYHEKSGFYVALFFNRDRQGDLIAQSAFSRNLVNWSSGEIIFNLGANKSKPCDSRNYAYPSLLDRNSRSANFETISDTPDLYLTRTVVKDCKKTAKRDLVRYRLKIGIP